MAFAISPDRRRLPVLLAKIAAVICAGPCFSYLVWALLRRKPVHLVLALVLNVALWVGGPMIVAHSAGAV